MKTIQELQVALKTEERLLRRRRDQLREELSTIEQRLESIRHERHRIELFQLVNVPGGVKIAYHIPVGHKNYELNDQKGTLLAVRRTTAKVDFSGTTWKVQLNDLLAVDPRRGGFNPLG